MLTHWHLENDRAVQRMLQLVLEDDIRFERGFGGILDQAWREMEDADQANPGFDILYVSYGEVRNGAPKELVSKNVFRPERGLWYLSGYVLSKKGAQALLDLLPCCGPIDLWINHQFRKLDVRALRRSVINQRRDLHSTNSYSILPALSRIGVLNNVNSALFHGRPIHSPVFAFGAPDQGCHPLQWPSRCLVIAAAATLRVFRNVNWRACSQVAPIAFSMLTST